MGKLAADMEGLIHNLPPETPSPIFLLEKQSFFHAFNGFTPENSGNGNASSASDEAKERRRMDERRQRRMISNRESARRSRMRKQRHLDELWSMLVRLINENKCLVDELGRVVEGYEKALEENAKLRDETSGLRKIISEIQVDGFIAYGDEVSIV